MRASLKMHLTAERMKIRRAYIVRVDSIRAPGASRFNENCIFNVRGTFGNRISSFERTNAAAFLFVSDLRERIARVGGNTPPEDCRHVSRDRESERRGGRERYNSVAFPRLEISGIHLSAACDNKGRFKRFER